MQSVVSAKCVAQCCPISARGGAFGNSHLLHSPPQTRRLHICNSVESPADAGEAAVPVSENISTNRKYLSLLPPFFSRETTLETLGSQTWGFVQPLGLSGQTDIRLRMVVARLDDGNLLLVGPVAPTGEVLAMLRSLGGNVAHIIVPNTSPEHWLYAPALADAFPSAALWFVPGFFEGKGLPLPGRSLLFKTVRRRGQCRVLGQDPFPMDLQDQVHCVLFDVPLFMEAAVSLPRHNALLLADTAVCLSAQDPEYLRMSEREINLSKRMGVWDRLGPVTKAVFEKYPEKGRAWVEAVLAECPDFDKVIPAHGSAPISENARAEFKNCFDFLY